MKTQIIKPLLLLIAIVSMFGCESNGSFTPKTPTSSSTVFGKRLVLQYGTLGAGTLTEAREKAVKWMEVVEIRQCKPNKFVAVERKRTLFPPVLR